MKPKTHHLTAVVAAVAGAFLLSACDQPTDTDAPPAADVTPGVPDATEATPDPDAAAPLAPESDEAPAPTATPEDGAASAADATDTGEPKVLNIFAWSEYVPQAVIDKFTERTGIRVNMQNYASNEEMLQKLFAGGGRYDIIQPSEYVVEELISEGALLELDHDRITNIGNLAPEFRELDFDSGNQFSVPWMAGTVGIVINTDQVTDEITGFEDVFQDQYRGQIVILDDAREIVSWALAANDIPMNDVSDENLEKIRPTLERWLPLVRVYDSDSPKTAMINGDVSLGIVWSGEGALLIDQEPDKFKWVLPKEGTHMFVDSLVIPKSAQHPNNAHLFINFILEPEVSAMISEDFPYLNPNKAAREILTPEQLANEASFPPDEVIDDLQTFKSIGEQSGAVDDLITTIKVQ